MKKTGAVVLIVLGISMLMSCGASLRVQSRPEINFRNYSTSAIDQIRVSWAGYAADGFVIKDQAGNVVTVPAGTGDSPSVATVGPLHYFADQGGELTFTATFADGSSESISSNHSYISFAEPVATVYDTTLTLTNKFSSAITYVWLTRGTTDTPWDDYSYRYMQLLGLPFAGIEVGAQIGLTLSSTNEAATEGDYHVYVRLDGDGADTSRYVGEINLNSGSDSITAQ